MMRRIAYVFALCLSLLLVPVSVAEAEGCGNNIHCPPPPPQSEANGAASTVDTHGVAFPHADPAGAVGTAARDNASCRDCEWTIAPACLMNGPSDDALCQNAVIACEGQAILYRVYMRRPGEPWHFVGTTCLGPGERPTSVGDVGEAIRQLVITKLPDASPSFQPAEGGVVNLPTIFAAGEPATMETEPFDVLGFTVVVSATARWEWTFDDGVMRPFEQPGGVYPNDDVTYTYPDAGGREVSVTTYWDASFTVDGDGPFQVPGAEISKTAGPITVPVREAKPELVGG
jgi:hypothetical protein